MHDMLCDGIRTLQEFNQKQMEQINQKIDIQPNMIAQEVAGGASGPGYGMMIE